MDTNNWRGQLLPETRQLITTKILDALKSGHHIADDGERIELQKIAQSVEQKSYAGATSKSDYLEEIDSKIVLLEKARAEARARAREWENELNPESRLRIVNKIMDTLKRHLPFSGQEGLHELWKIAQRFEEKIFTTSTSQSDYLRRISVKMLTMEGKSQGPWGNHLPSNQVGPSNNPYDPDMNLRDRNRRSRRRPTWTRDYEMN